MSQETEKHPLLTDTLSAFATELRQLLIEKGESALTVQAASLPILEQCRCEDDSCGKFARYAS